MSDDPKKPTPEETIRSGIKTAVAAANNFLGSVETMTAGVKQPVESTWETVKTQSKSLADSTVYTYQRRREFAPQIIGGSAVIGGGIVALRRGRIAGVLGAAAAGGAAYAIVYDEINLETIPDYIFGKKE
jgi:hypothetical protein